jgi:hypothetical protein
MRSEVGARRSADVVQQPDGGERADAAEDQVDTQAETDRPRRGLGTRTVIVTPATTSTQPIKIAVTT